MESASGEKGERIGFRQWADGSLQEGPPSSDAGEAGGKEAFTQVSTGSERVTGYDEATDGGGGSGPQIGRASCRERV